MNCRTVKGTAAAVSSAGWVTASIVTWTYADRHLAWLLLSVGLAASATAVFGISLLPLSPKQSQRAAYDQGWREGRRAERLIGGHSAQVIRLHSRKSS